MPGAPTLGPVTITGYSQIGFYTIEGPPNPYHMQNIYAFSDNLFYSRGKHGVQVRNADQSLRRGNAGADPDSRDHHLWQCGRLSAGHSDYLRRLDPGSNRSLFDYQTFGFYAQDDWHASRRLTVNMGIRYEFMTTIQELNNKGYAIRNIAADATATQGPVMRNRTLLNFSPRAGFAWDVFGNGHTAIRGGLRYLLRYRQSRGAHSRLNSDGTPPLVSKFSISNSTANGSDPAAFFVQSRGHRTYARHCHRLQRLPAARGAV